MPSVALACISLLWCCRNPPQPPPVSTLPPLMLWAWERPEDLRFLDPQTTGVAVLAQTLTLTATGVEQHLRQQPLQLPQGTRRLAVTRLEKHEGGSLEGHEAELADLIVSRAIRKGAPENTLGVQIDFDAGLSERGLYVSLLKAVRARLPKAMLLSATGLASWCTPKTWLSDAPVDLWVPQFFRMGNDFKAFRAKLDSPDALPVECRSAWGMALDEPFTQRPSQTLFVFKPATPWTGEDFVNINPASRR